ncbi:hypothetical protein BKA56DRAFT_574154 [Ilyonectria sp. MPI-CAGE-AT-0026]|nr:hypothetical protein BKA56DRAFT_574154 [Ilyonectria sp. MPI-CAGE-AT-0026]
MSHSAASALTGGCSPSMTILGDRLQEWLQDPFAPVQDKLVRQQPSVPAGTTTQRRSEKKQRRMKAGKMVADFDKRFGTSKSKAANR